MKFTSPSSNRDEALKGFFPGVHFDDVYAIYDFAHESDPFVGLGCYFTPQLGCYLADVN